MVTRRSLDGLGLVAVPADLSLHRWIKSEYANIQPIHEKKMIKTPACLFNVRFTQYSHICTEAHSFAAFIENLRGPNRSAQRMEPVLTKCKKKTKMHQEYSTRKEETATTTVIVDQKEMIFF